MKLLLKKAKKSLKPAVKKLQESVLNLFQLKLEEVVGKVIADDIYDKSTGEVIASANEALTESKIFEFNESWY